MKTPYRTYLDLPPLAGVCRKFADATRPGLSVEQCVSRLKRYHYTLKRLHEIFIVRLTSEPVYELKMAFSLHAHYCAEHVTALRRRVGEMREPPLGLEAVPHSALELFFDEVRNAPGNVELLWGIYDKALPALDTAMRVHLAETNPLADHPSVRVLRFALLELQEMLSYGAEALLKLEAEAKRESVRPWLALLDDCLAASGGLSGWTTEVPRPLTPIHSGKPFQYDPVPRRDGRFPDPYNMGVNAEVFLYDPQFPRNRKL